MAPMKPTMCDLNTTDIHCVSGVVPLCECPDRSCALIHLFGPSTLSKSRLNSCSIMLVSGALVAGPM